MFTIYSSNVLQNKNQDYYSISISFFILIIANYFFKIKKINTIIVSIICSIHLICFGLMCWDFHNDIKNVVCLVLINTSSFPLLSKIESFLNFFIFENIFGILYGVFFYISTINLENVIFLTCHAIVTVCLFFKINKKEENDDEENEEYKIDNLKTIAIFSINIITDYIFFPINYNDDLLLIIKHFGLLFGIILLIDREKDVEKIVLFISTIIKFILMILIYIFWNSLSQTWHESVLKYLLFFLSFILSGMITTSLIKTNNKNRKFLFIKFFAQLVSYQFSILIYYFHSHFMKQNNNKK